MTAATDTGKSTIIINGVLNDTTNKWYYVTAANKSGLTDVTYGTAITPSAWTQLTANSTEITPTSGHTVARVVEVDSSNKPVAVADVVILNIG